MPDKTLAEKGDVVKGGKMAKERLTVLFCCSASGEKLKPLVIGKAQKPHAFSGVNISRLPVTWKSSSKAWMNTTIFTEWLEQINRKMRQQKRKIMLFMDNVSSHVGSDALGLSNVTVKFLPPSTTSYLQPLDGGIIQAFKLRYRQKLMECILAHVDASMSGTALAKQITVLNAMKWCG